MKKMRSLKQTYRINAPIKLVWQALVEPRLIDAWGAGPSKMNAKPGSNFSLWGGVIHGKNIEIIDEKELTQQWYGGDWKEPSLVSIKLQTRKRGLRTKNQGLGTKVELTHENIPPDMYKDIKKGWRYYFFAPMKLYLEEQYGNPDVDYHQGG